MQLAIGGKILLKPTFIISGFIVLLATLIGGLRPILGLRIIPDTLYIDHAKNLTFKNGEIIKVDNIQELTVHEIGVNESHMQYYEILLNKTPNNISTRKRKSLVLVEPYNIKNFFSTRSDFLNHLKKLGLSESKIIQGEGSLKTILGFRNRFKK